MAGWGDGSMDEFERCVRGSNVWCKNCHVTPDPTESNISRAADNPPTCLKYRQRRHFHPTCRIQHLALHLHCVELTSTMSSFFSRPAKSASSSAASSIKGKEAPKPTAEIFTSPPDGVVPSRKWEYNDEQVEKVCNVRLAGSSRHLSWIITDHHLRLSN